MGEPFTEEELALIEEGLADVRAGRTLSHAEIEATIEQMRVGRRRGAMNPRRIDWTVVARAETAGPSRAEDANGTPFGRRRGLIEKLEVAGFPDVAQRVQQT